MAELGFTVTIESVDGRTVIIESNWLVKFIERTDDTTVKLKVAKPTQAPEPSNQEPPAPQPEPPTPEPKPEPNPDVYYKNCAEARANGAAPIHRGEPGYRAGLDRDGDGIACDT